MNLNFYGGPIDEARYDNKSTGTGMCWTDDGKMWISRLRDIGYPSASNTRYSFELWCYDGTWWKLIESDLYQNSGFIFINGSNYRNGLASGVQSDGTFLYYAFWALDGTYPDGEIYVGANYMNSTIYVARYHPPTATTTIIGTLYGVPRPRNVTTTGRSDVYGATPYLRVAPNGDVYVAWIEKLYGVTPYPYVYPTSDIVVNSDRPFLHYWDGTTWHDTQMPGIYQTISSNYLTDAVVDAGAMKQIIMTFCHHDGPSNTPSCVWTAWENGPADVYRRITIYAEYEGGTSWSTPIEFLPEDKWLMANVDHQYAYGAWQQGMYMANDGKKPYAIMLYGAGYSGVDKTCIFTVTDDGTDVQMAALQQPSDVFGDWTDYVSVGLAGDENGIHFAYGTESIGSGGIVIGSIVPHFGANGIIPAQEFILGTGAEGMEMAMEIGPDGAVYITTEQDFLDIEGEYSYWFGCWRYPVVDTPNDWALNTTISVNARFNK